MIKLKFFEEVSTDSLSDKIDKYVAQISPEYSVIDIKYSTTSVAEHTVHSAMVVAEENKVLNQGQPQPLFMNNSTNTSLQNDTGSVSKSVRVGDYTVDTPNGEINDSGRYVITTSNMKEFHNIVKQLKQNGVDNNTPIDHVPVRPGTNTQIEWVPNK